jgi:hypothetical protein
MIQAADEDLAQPTATVSDKDKHKITVAAGSTSYAESSKVEVTRVVVMSSEGAAQPTALPPDLAQDVVLFQLEEWMHQLQRMQGGPISQLTLDYLAARGETWSDQDEIDIIASFHEWGLPVSELRARSYPERKEFEAWYRNRATAPDAGSARVETAAVSQPGGAEVAADVPGSETAPTAPARGRLARDASWLAYQAIQDIPNAAMGGDGAVLLRGPDGAELRVGFTIGEPAGGAAATVLGSRGLTYIVVSGDADAVAARLAVSRELHSMLARLHGVEDDAVAAGSEGAAVPPPMG